MRTFDDESFILENYRDISSRDIKFYGRFFHCLRIKWLTKSRLFSKTWTDSSSKSDPPPDFHNDRFGIMMEMMRVDDCVNSIDGKHVANSFEHANKTMKKYAGNDYRKKLNGDLFFIPDTRNTDEFNFNGYINNFERVISKHSSKISEYRKNYPKCKTTVFFVSDESDDYVQVIDPNDLNRKGKENIPFAFYPHFSHLDEGFLNIIKQCQADYIVWFFVYKSIYVDDKKIKQPRVCIIDVKHMRKKGHAYDHNLMMKVVEPGPNNSINGGLK